MNQKHTHKHKGPRQPMHIKFMEKLTDYSYPSLFLIWISMAFGFALLYWAMEYIPGHGPIDGSTMKPVTHFTDALYYSIITATSTGYGDIVPHGFSRILASIQSIGALFVFAIFVTKLVSYRQEEALQQVHKLTFEDVFHNIREGLFIVRKDFDHIINRLENDEGIDAEHWKNLVIAYKQCQSLIQEIPDFYDASNKLYTIDARREQLLQESVQRTVHRINSLLDVFSKKNIDWTSHEPSIKELKELLHIIDVSTPLWHERSPYDKPEAFEDILHVKQSVASRIEAALPSA